MTAISTCPDESELLPAATGEPADDAIARHLDGCPICAGRVELLRAELTALRRDLGDAVKPASTEPDPAVDRQGEPSAGGTTLSWLTGPAGDAAAEPLGPEAVAAARARAEGRPERPGAIGKYLVVDQLDTLDVGPIAPLGPELPAGQGDHLADEPPEDPRRSLLVAGAPAAHQGVEGIVRPHPGLPGARRSSFWISPERHYRSAGLPPQLHAPQNPAMAPTEFSPPGKKLSGRRGRSGW
jgi:hypothetical protein